MEKKEITHTLEQKFAEKLLKILRNEGCLENANDDEILETIKVDFKDGVAVEIDVCNGVRDDNSSPYLNVNWFKDNMCLYAPDTDPEGELFGTYDFEDDDEEINYILNLVIGEKTQTL
ncbi:hypothetical protein [Bacillus toyonensis]|uniref:hypothetical protein n=1 Tax=Bacillus toyonensis TaxID=155322 RepID=UPI002E1B9288|nr:hypothetical protein [Bacillus toyonensis]